MTNTHVTAAKRRLLDRIKTTGTATAVELAEYLGLTDVAVRQHLLDLERRGVVEHDKSRPIGRGRPSDLWSLTEAAAAFFPDRHSDLTVGLIDAIRESFGAEGLERIVQARGRKQLEAYRRAFPSHGARLSERLEALSAERTAEGYMAEVERADDGSFRLVEHHCPICDAARSCVGLCSGELDLFRDLFAGTARVERTEHILQGASRCAYKITPE